MTREQMIDAAVGLAIKPRVLQLMGLYEREYGPSESPLVVETDDCVADIRAEFHCIAEAARGMI